MSKISWRMRLKQELEELALKEPSFVPLQAGMFVNDSLELLKMDLSDVGVRHAVAFTNLNIRHSVDVSASSVAVAREIRISIIAIVLGLTAATIVKSVLASKRPVH